MSVRDDMHAAMVETLADNAAHHNWIYAFVRPLPVIHRPYIPKTTKRADCSKGAQDIAWLGHGPDPFGMNFGVWGNSSTAYAHLPHLDHPTQLQVGDYVVMGYLGSEHMTVVKEADPVHGNPLLWSDGHQGAPDTYHYNDDTRLKTCLHNPVHDEPDHPKGSPEALRDRTGFTAWYQWSEGTGFWHKYGRRNKSVRPNVPRRIPLRWWKHKARLLMLKRKRRSNKATTHPQN